MDLYKVDSLTDYVGSKYSLCIALAKRARELGQYISAKRNMERASVVPPLVETDSEDPLEITVQELFEGKITFSQVK
ncbi:MAG: DNA-directed RNA polymerase subunit omega [Actinobacteria bacterium]|nr:DNA-directed RNA polymerase subunit omega [Actinomycetota bacterium]